MNARYGFIQITKDKLKEINVFFNEELIRKYALNYTDGKFHKTLLENIEEYDADGKLFNTHSFEYYGEEVSNDNFISGEITTIDNIGETVKTDFLGLNGLNEFSSEALE